MKGKDMILSDFLSWQTHDNSDPHDIIPISFNMHNTLHKRYYKIEMKERYLGQRCSQTKSSGTKITRSPWCKENMLDTNLLPKKQKVIMQIKKTIDNKPRLGQGRAGIRHREPKLTENITASRNKSHETYQR